MGSWTILIIILLVVLITWWALLRNVKNYKPDFDVHSHEEHAEDSKGEMDAAERQLASEVEEPHPGAAAAVIYKSPAAEPVQPAAVVAEPPVAVDPPTAVEPPAAVEPTAVEAPTAAVPVDPPAIPATAAAALAASGTDDLTVLEGVGPKVAEILNSNGIHTFADVAAADVNHLRQLLEGAGLRFIDPSTWPQQAALAAEGRTAELQALMATLRGGRKVE